VCRFAAWIGARSAIAWGAKRLLTSRVPPLALARSLAAAYYDRAFGAII
jgi:hypothetical protein